LEAYQGTLRCTCGRMAWGRGEPCKHLICGNCVRDECPTCARSPRQPNVECDNHTFPACPHPACRRRALKGFNTVAGIGRELYSAVRVEATTMRDVLEQLDRLLVHPSSD
ncbi:hypothetical protein FB107DRAFT_214870, partial [Schizophyllum commune]